jgi:cysteinyl-tRNA synthetase
MINLNFKGIVIKLAMKIFNTLTRQKEEFKPIKKKVGLYTCGPTVYWYAHVGNLRSYIFEDVLKRTLEFNGYKVKHIMNITDVGHLTSDSDTGEDKLEKATKSEGRTAQEIAKFYTEAFIKDLKRLNIEYPDYFCKATEYIKEQIRIVKILEDKGYAYIIEDGVYLDTSKLKEYGKLANLDIKKLKAGARVEMVKGKKNSTDFALWKLTPKGVKRQQEWDSPWGKGFPGWHIECTAIGVKTLGLPFDIHCGGIDHIPVHHTNEIAQAQAAFGIDPVNYWMHNEFLVLKEGKMSKSKGNILTLANLIEKKINPLAYRYLSLITHYRSQLMFDMESLGAAQNALDNLYERVLEIKSKPKKTEKTEEYSNSFKEEVNDDLNTPKAIALMWDVLKSKELTNSEKYYLLLEFDKIFGLKISEVKEIKASREVKILIHERLEFRNNKDWKKSDEIRIKIEKKCKEEGNKCKINDTTGEVTITKL